MSSSSSSSSSNSTVSTIKTALGGYNKDKVERKTVAEIRAKALMKAGNSSDVIVTSPSATVDYPKFMPESGRMDVSVKTMKDDLMKLKSPSGSPFIFAGPSFPLPWDLSRTFSYSQNNSLHAPDTAFFHRMVNFGGRIREQALKTVDLVRCNGTRSGLLTRMQTKLVGPPATPFDLRPPYTRIAHRLPLSDAKPLALNAFEKMLTSESYALSRLNSRADAGFPYAFVVDQKNAMPKVEDVTLLQPFYYSTEIDKQKRKNIPLLTKPMPIIDHALTLARYILTNLLDEDDPMLALKKFSEFTALHPELVTFMMKRKDERMNRSDYYKKVRPYGVMPLPMRLVGMWAMAPIEIGLQSFFDNPESCSAYHFCPYFGGAAKMLRWYRYHINKGKTKKNIYFFGICYGDDQLWCVYYPKSNKLVVIGPDVNAMDMSTRNYCIIPFLQWVRSFYGEKIMPQIQFNALSVLVSLMFKHFAHLGAAYVIRMIHSLISGVNGTTVMNIFNSACMQSTIESEIEKLEQGDNLELLKVENFSLLLQKLILKIQNTYGYTFKDVKWEKGVYAGDLKWEILDGYDDILSRGVSVPFLSMVLTKLPKKILNSEEKKEYHKKKSQNATDKNPLPSSSSSSSSKNESVDDGENDDEEPEAIETDDEDAEDAKIDVSELQPDEKTIIADNPTKLYLLPKDIGYMVAGLVLPGNQRYPTLHSLDRIRGVYITGGWADNDTREFLEDSFVSIVKTMPALKDTSESSLVEIDYGIEEAFMGEMEVQDLVDLMKEKSDIGLPTYEVMKDFNRLPRTAFIMKYSTRSIVKAGTSSITATSAAEKSYTENLASDLTESDAFDLQQLGRAIKQGLPNEVVYKSSAMGHGNANNSLDDEIKKSKQKERLRIKQILWKLKYDIVEERLKTGKYHIKGSKSSEMENEEDEEEETKEKIIQSDINSIIDEIEEKLGAEAANDARKYFEDEADYESTRQEIEDPDGHDRNDRYVKSTLFEDTPPELIEIATAPMKRAPRVVHFHGRA